VCPPKATTEGFGVDVMEDHEFDLPPLIPTCKDLEGALDDVLRPLKAAVGIFWAFNRKPENGEQQTIVDLCLMIAEAACQIEYLIEYSTIDGKGVAFALVEHPCMKKVIQKEEPPTSSSDSRDPHCREKQ
jgi:hypothetical protein